MSPTRDQLAALPPSSQIRATWADGHQPPVIVTRIDGEHGGAATGGYILAATQQWLGIADWGADIEILHVPASGESRSVEDEALDAVVNVRDSYPRVHNDAPSEAIVEALAARGLLATGDAQAAIARVLALADLGRERLTPSLTPHPEFYLPETVDHLIGILQRAERRAEQAETKLAAVRTALTNHPPVCDRHSTEDPIACGWKRAVADIAAVVEGGDR